MKTLGLLIGAQLLAVSAMAQTIPTGMIQTPKKTTLLEKPGIRKALRPAYRLAEGVSDRLYGLISLRLFLHVLPNRLNEDLYRPPEKDSYDVFSQHFQTKQERFLSRMYKSHPKFTSAGGDGYTPYEVKAWEDRARQEQISVFIDVFRDTLLDRYQIMLFRDSTQHYAKDMRNWDPSFVALGATIGGTFLYYNGMHATMRAGNVKVGLDFASGRRIVKSYREKTTLRHAMGIELGYKGLPFTFSTDAGMMNGALYHETLALNFHKRF